MTKYSDKLKDPRWQKKRLKILSRDRFKCQCCLSGERTLHVHHINYLSNSEPWEIPNRYLISLCDKCHSLENFIDFKNLWKRRLKLRLVRNCTKIPDFIINIIFKILKLKAV